MGILQKKFMLKSIDSLKIKCKSKVNFESHKLVSILFLLILTPTHSIANNLTEYIAFGDIPTSRTVNFQVNKKLVEPKRSREYEEPIEQGRVDKISNNYREIFNLEHEITPYTSSLFGEKIGLSTGSISFQQTDFSIPGNSQLPVNITRVFVGSDSLDSNTRDFGSWGLDLPHVRSNIMTLDGEVNFKGSWGNGIACSGNLGDGGDWTPYVDNSLVPERGQSVWNGDNIYIPGKASQKILSTVKSGVERRVTNQHWKIDCYTTANGYEGFKVTTTDGTKYTFGQLKLIKGKDFKIIEPNSRFRKTSPNFRTYHAFMLPTEIEDKFGNKVTYSYGDYSRLQTITATDGRSVALTYYEPNLTAEQEFAHHIKTVSVNGRVWTYKYKNKGPILDFGQLNTLHKVERPDGKAWQFDHPDTSKWKQAFVGRHELSIPPEEKTSDWRTCEYFPNRGEFVTMTHPEGLQATFNYKTHSLKRFDVDWHLISDGAATEEWSSPIWPEHKPCTLAYSITSKVITRLDLSKDVWIYEYIQPYKGYWESTSGNVPVESSYHQGLNLDLPYGLTANDLRTTEVTAPDGSKMAHHISGKWGWTENKEIFTDYYDKDGTTLLRRVGRIEEKSPLRGSSNVKNDFTSAYFMRTQKNKDSYHYSDGTDSYITLYSGFNVFDAPENVAETGGTHVRYTTKTFKHDLENWVVNLPEMTSIGNTATSLEQVSKIDYATFSATGTVLLPHITYGRSESLTEIKSYHSFGKINKIEFNSDMSQGQIGKTYQRFSAYKRGKPITVYLPNRYKTGEMLMSQEVDNNGWIKSVTNLNQKTTTYSYDELGRLTSINHPGTHFNDTVFVWSQDSNYQVRTEKSCRLNTTQDGCSSNLLLSRATTYDGYLRPIQVKKTDHETSISQYQHFSYNIDNQITKNTFSSYSSNSTRGVTNKYDGLQRKISTQFFGGGTVKIDYLNSNQQQVTDAENNITTTGYMAFSAPSYNQPLIITSPESVVTTLAIDIFGNTTSITQSGMNGSTNVSQTEYRAYDNQGNLCQISRADIGTTIFKRNSVGEIEWQAQGQNAINNTMCNTSADSADKISFTYDNLGNQRTISYGDATPTRTFTHDNNGNIERITGHGFSQSYNYNSLNLLEDETLSITGRSANLTLDYGYNTLGNLASLKYPDGIEAINFAPNAFGQPTQAIRTYADESTDIFVKGGIKKASYYPRGSIDTFTYGNGVVHKTTLNDRLMPSQITDKLGNSDRVNLSYEYDNNNNITKLTNARNGIYSLSSLTYDGLDRLKTTAGGLGIGSSTITYDGLGNIRTYSNNSPYNPSNLTYNYKANFLLNDVKKTGTNTKVRDFSSTGSYDSRGNVKANGNSKGIKTFSYNLANQMTNAGGNSYIYDGYNRRVKSVTANGKTEYSMYSQSGKLLYRETGQGGINYIFLGSKLVAKEGTGVVSSGDSIMNYKPFGESIETPKDDVGYTGHKFDTDLGLSYMQARYYDPVIGRFYSNDPVGTTGHDSVVHGFNRYAYANNNPYKYTDPTGKIPLLIPVVIFIAKEGASEAVEQVTGVPMPTVKNAAKAVTKQLAKSTRVMVSPKNLIPTQSKAEMTGNNVKKLTKSMKKEGFVEGKGTDGPVSVSTNSMGKLEIQNGHHRVEAAIKAKIEKIPVEVD